MSSKSTCNIRKLILLKMPSEMAHVRLLFEPGTEALCQTRSSLSWLIWIHPKVKSLFEKKSAKLFSAWSANWGTVKIWVWEFTELFLCELIFLLFNRFATRASAVQKDAKKLQFDCTFLWIRKSIFELFLLPAFNLLAICLLLTEKCEAIRSCKTAQGLVRSWTAAGVYLPFLNPKKTVFSTVHQKNLKSKKTFLFAVLQSIHRDDFPALNFRTEVPTFWEIIFLM